MLARAAPRTTWLVAGAALLLIVLEIAPRLGANSPDTRFTLPRYSLGYFWDTPLGWTGVIDGAQVNRDAVQFSSLAGFFHGLSVPVPPEDNVYVRFSGYALLGSSLAPLLGTYLSFVVVNVLLWLGSAFATYLLAVRKTGSAWVGVMASLLVSTAPAFAALAGQPLPYVASYALFVLGLLLFDQVRLFEVGTTARTAAVAGFAAGMSLLFYDLYMVPAFVVGYGLLRRMPLRTLALVLVMMALPRVIWSGYWQVMHLPSYSHNEQHPMEALLAWLDTERIGSGLRVILGYAALAAHGLLNIAAVFMFLPLAFAAYELWKRRSSPDAKWFVAVAVAGFGPALFMLSTWPHLPRWYAYGFPAVYILAAAFALRLGPRLGVALVVVPSVLLANLDLVGMTRLMELLLFQPAQWSYLWSP